MLIYIGFPRRGLSLRHYIKKNAAMICAAVMLVSAAGCADGKTEDEPEQVDWETMEFAEGVVEARNAEYGDNSNIENPRDAAQTAVAYLETRVADLTNEKATLVTQHEEALIFASLVEEEQPELAETYRNIAAEAELKLAQFDDDILNAEERLKIAQTELAEADGKFPEDKELSGDYEAPPDDGTEPIAEPDTDPPPDA